MNIQMHTYGVPCEGRAYCQTQTFELEMGCIRTQCTLSVPPCTPGIPIYPNSPFYTNAIPQRTLPLPGTPARRTRSKSESSWPNIASAKGRPGWHEFYLRAADREAEGEKDSGF